eukprot:1664259-Alexandrium_andersonii.AAC.1
MGASANHNTRHSGCAGVDWDRGSASSIVGGRLREWTQIFVRARVQARLFQVARCCSETRLSREHRRGEHKTD